jgi:exosortase
VPRPHGRLVPVYLALAALLACVLWSYWPTLTELRAFWARNQDYSVGALVPLVALYLVWRQRRVLLAEPVRPCAWGLAVLLAAELLRQIALFYGVASGERYAVVLSLAGAVLLAAGRRVLRHSGWILVFLLLMVPLPARIHEAIALPLQRLATTAAVFALELLGFFVVREGHVLHLNEQTTIGVAEACSGLRMLTAFVVVASLLAFLIHRPRWHKVVLLAASIPIAVLSNAIRSVLTALVVYYAQNPALSEAFHDAAGLAMMPLGLLLSLALLKFLGWLSAGQRAAPPAPEPSRPRDARPVRPGSRSASATGRTRLAAPVGVARWGRPAVWQWLPRLFQGRGRA